jgi:hypothetical protein
MSPQTVYDQMREVIERLITVNLSVTQFFPSIRTGTNGDSIISRKASSSIALKNIPYEEIYVELERTQAFDIKLIDGGLLILQYHFNHDGTLVQHRLAYFPSPVLPSIDESPALYEQDELYGDVIARQLVRFPIRFDYAPSQAQDLVHPISHLTLGQYENCRIPVAGPLTPATFALFIVRNFYARAYKRNKNVFDRKHLSIPQMTTITDAERRISHFVCGR